MPVRRVRRARLARIACPPHRRHLARALDEITPGQPYGYRARPYEPRDGHRFNPNKLLLDPYAQQLIGRFVERHAFRLPRGSARADLSFDRRDNAGAMPKAVVTAPMPARAAPRRPGIAWEDTVIYEAHVKGLTMLREDVPPQWREDLSRPGGAGAGRPSQTARRERLELLPIHTFIDEPFLPARGCTTTGATTR